MASVVQARNAVNMNGTLLGSRSFQKTCHSLAAQLRISSRLRGSTASSPRRVPMNVGKKVISAAMAILEPGPMPNQTMASGASATIGTEAEAIAYGRSRPATAGERLASIAATSPRPQPIP